MNEQQTTFLEALGFHINEFSFGLSITRANNLFKSECVSVAGYSHYGSNEMKPEISISSSSDKSIEMALQIQKDLELAIKLVNEYTELGEANK